MAYSLHTKFAVKEGGQAELVEILLKAAAVLENSNDCISYLISTSPSDKLSVYVAEIWTDRQAAEVSLGNEEIKTLIGKAMPLIVGMPEKISETEIVGGKGLR